MRRPASLAWADPLPEVEREALLREMMRAVRLTWSERWPTLGEALAAMRVEEPLRLLVAPTSFDDGRPVRRLRLLVDGGAVVALDDGTGEVLRGPLPSLGADLGARFEGAPAADPFGRPCLVAQEVA